MKHSNTTIKPTQIAIYVLFIIALFVFEFLNVELSSNIIVSNMLSNSIFRVVGGLIFISLMISLGYKILFKFPISIKAVLILLPALVISINNFPIIAYFNNQAYLVQPIYTVYIFVLESISSAFFEEIIFRSIILVFLLERLPRNKKGVFYAILISSLLFGLLHFVNLFSGVSIYNVSLQIGYSFLMGMLWAVMYLKTKNIWLTIILHGTYNFFGQVMFSLGVVNGRYDIYTIIITSVLAIGAIIYGLKIFQSLPNDPINDN